MENQFKVELIATHPTNRAQVKRITTPHGSFLTPTFMPVGTKAAVNILTPEQLKEMGTQILLGGNTYHMLCAPGLSVIQAAGGMHPFMGWNGPMLTDSGGFQLFSLSKNSKICKIDETGARFKHPRTGEILILTPEKSIEAQRIIGADIIMAFDQCTEDRDRTFVQAAMARTHRWLAQCTHCHAQDPYSAYGKKQALFGIIQGGQFEDLRRESAEFVLSQALDGIAIGGEAAGETMEEVMEKTEQVLDWVVPLFPKEKPAYVMGVGLHPRDLLRVTALGVDMFDCVAPTRQARHGSLYTGQVVPCGDWLDFESPDPRARINISKALYAKDQAPIQEGCSCYTCRHFSRSYLHHLFKAKVPTYHLFACLHNVHVMHQVCTVIRSSMGFR